MADNGLGTAVHVPPRTRAPKACLCCRARKVRCDAVLRQGPCTNCALDRRPCEVKGRPSKYQTAKSRSISTQDNSTSPPERSSRVQLQPDTEANPKAPSPKSLVPARAYRAGLTDVGLEPTMEAHVIYTYFPFLKADPSLMLKQDVQFLEMQGCFRVPDRPAVDQFVREYFLHVHPTLPLLDESAFWDMYYGRTCSQADNPTLSLFVFQAMLFVSCGFLTAETVQRLGFSSTRSARAVYYRRAKLLFDFTGEINTLASAQGALLLSFRASMGDCRKVNSLWLTTAIGLTQDLGADHPCLLLDRTPEEKNALKRLWWCCIIRDRILPLGVRRRLHISLDEFDMANMVLTESDFEDEIHNSHVYDPETKLSLVQLFLALCGLALPLTNIITTIYPSSKPVDVHLLGPTKARQTLDRIQTCKHGLQTWFERTMMQFPTPASIMSTSKSLILYTNLMYLYYHAARLSLYHHEALISTAQLPGLEFKENNLPEARVQVEDATAQITEHLKELVQLKLTLYLPISVVAFTAIPFVLHILDVRLSTTPSQLAQRQGQLNIYMQAMESLQARYEETDEVREFINAVVDSATPRPPSTVASARTRPLSMSPVSTTNDWGNMMLQQPNVYFRLMHTIDLSLSMARYPEESDLPLMLKSTPLSLHRITMRTVGARGDSNPNGEEWETPANMSQATPLPTSHIPDSPEAINHLLGYSHADLGLGVSLDAYNFDLELSADSMFASVSPTRS
ncbi:fungal-specific transcription factor domain-containing protein [Aspergillus carlsbadensis]|nr:fungal-specific transcription factor domain-containing protein [Aspergillus carlsbadensis]